MTTASFVEVDDLQVVFRRGRQRVTALDGISLSIARGEAVGIVGESGSGKTTLARVLLGLEHATRGRAAVEGRSVADWLKRGRAS